MSTILWTILGTVAGAVIAYAVRSILASDERRDAIRSLQAVIDQHLDREVNDTTKIHKLDATIRGLQREIRERDESEALRATASAVDAARLAAEAKAFREAPTAELRPPTKLSDARRKKKPR